jgi:hypothetical protein
MIRKVILCYSEKTNIYPQTVCSVFQNVSTQPRTSTAQPTSQWFATVLRPPPGFEEPIPRWNAIRKEPLSVVNNDASEKPGSGVVEQSPRAERNDDTQLGPRGVAYILLPRRICHKPLLQ